MYEGVSAASSQMSQKKINVCMEREKEGEDRRKRIRQTGNNDGKNV